MSNPNWELFFYKLEKALKGPSHTKQDSYSRGNTLLSFLNKIEPSLSKAERSNVQKRLSKDEEN